MRRQVEFKSKGDTCRADFLTPDQGKGPFPTVVMAGGWCYVKEIVMPHYADYLVKAGLGVLIFDYRRFGASDGQPRQHIDPWDEIEDYKNAISYVQTLPEVDPNRIGAWGISYSGGHVLVLAATDPRIKAIASNIPVVDGYPNMRRVQGERRFIKLMDLIMQDRKQRFETGKGGFIPMSTPEPDTLSTWPFGDVTEIFNKIKTTEAPRHEHYSTIESVELLLNYTVFPYARRIINTPTLMIVAEGDEKTLWDLEIDAFNVIPTAKKKLTVLPNVSHMSLYSTKSHLEVAGQEAAGWFKEHLINPYQRVATPAR